MGWGKQTVMGWCWQHDVSQAFFATGENGISVIMQLLSRVKCLYYASSIAFIFVGCFYFVDVLIITNMFIN